MARTRRQDPSPTEESSAGAGPVPAPGRNADTGTEAKADTETDLTYNEARAALELVLSELQASDLDVEAMASLYLRGRTYASRCEAILNQVEQEVLIWDDLANPETSPLRYETDSARG
jgi:exodeoxyribonuclease VII small subunit